MNEIIENNGLMKIKLKELKILLTILEIFKYSMIFDMLNMHAKTLWLKKKKKNT